MESPDLNRPRPDDAQLDAWLKANAVTAPLPDDGFSQRVLHALPAPIDPAALAQAQREAQAETWRRALFCAAGAAAGLVVHLAGPGGGIDLAGYWQSLGGMQFDVRESLSTLGTVGLAVASLALVYWEQLTALRRTHA